MPKWLELRNRQKMIEDNLEKALSENEGLSLNEFYVLFFLNTTDDKSMRLNHLQKHVGLSQSAMSRMIARMENKNCGVIERHSCDNDKRGIYINLTEKGQEKLVSGQQTVDDVLDEYLK
ncbi:hypothetical protein IGI42_004105 [Enterococcus sp. AZ109]